VDAADTFLETILAREGTLPWLPWHQRRLERTCRDHGIGTYDLAALLSPPEEGEYRCRFLYGAVGYEVQYLPYRRRQTGSLKIVRDDGIDYAYKRADRRALDALFAQRGGADDVLIVRNGLVTDTTIANTAFFLGGEWLTPERPLLEGTARQRLIEAGKLRPAVVTPETAREAEKIAVMNALSGFVEVPGGILFE
jgi:4-amino-4-deoxychorismate lyase